MARTVITDNIWTQLQKTMQTHGCDASENDRQMMEAIIWKLRTGAPWEDIPSELCAWKKAYDCFNRWAKKGLWTQFFLVYENMCVKNGYSQIEAKSAVISIQTLEDDNEGQLGSLEDEPLSFTSSIRMETRLILKSLGASTTNCERLINQL